MEEKAKIKMKAATEKLLTVQEQDDPHTSLRRRNLVFIFCVVVVISVPSLLEKAPITTGSNDGLEVARFVICGRLAKKSDVVWRHK